ncbi:MAG TPA: G8 domain-containing protein [Tepidisphaeraceae bacterium]|nr:G8 domain-containing protein [Tepidisphaeraceae bacterium]
MRGNSLHLAVIAILGGAIGVPMGMTNELPAAPSESRQNAIDHHPGDMVRQDEHTAMLDLVPVEQATNTAIADGDWNAKATWKDGAIPAAGAKVVIPAGRIVTIHQTLDQQRLQWVRVDGTLRFDPSANTSIKAVTIVGTPGSSIEIGTEKERIHADKSARIIIADRGPRQAIRAADPFDLSGGFLAHGTVRVFGAQYTSHSMPTRVPRAGDSTVAFAVANTGWKVGDTLLFPGLDREQKFRDVSIDPWTNRELPAGTHEDEEVTIKAIADGGKTITLDHPLKYQHGDIYGFPGAVPVGNLTRNVIFKSENTADISRRGHVMFMHTQDVVIDSALFHELGRTSVEGDITNPQVKDGKLVEGSDANTIGRYALHFHIRWGATYKQTPFVVRNSAIVGSPKLGLVNHGGYGLIDDNVSYRVRGSHFFTENGSEIGRFKGNLAVRSNGTDGDDDGLPIPKGHGYDGHPLNIGHGGHGFWLQGGGVEVTDCVAIGHTYSAFGFFVANNRIISFGGPQERNNPRTKGTPWEKLDVFLAENLPDISLAHGQPFVHTSAVPFHAARCIGLASADGLRVRGIDRTEFMCLHDKRDLIEDCQFVWNGEGYELGYSPGLSDLRNCTFIGASPDKPIDSFGIGGGNHIPGFLRLENVTIDGYRTGYSVPPRGENIIKGGFINGVRKIVLNYPWGGKFIVDGVKFGAMKGEEKEKILFGYAYNDNGTDLLYAPPYSNWTRKFQPFEFTYNGRTIYYDDQLPSAIPFDPTSPRWTRDRYGIKDHGPLSGKTSRQLWDMYHLAIGGRLAPADVTPCPDIRGGWYGSNVAFQPIMESEPNTAYYGGERYEKLIGKDPPDNVHLQPRYMYDPIHVQTPRKAYIATIYIDGKTYHSAPTDLVAGVNLIPIETGTGTRYLPVGSPVQKKAYSSRGSE